MNKLLSFLGSILLSCFVVPAFYFVSNYPQFGLQDTFLIVTLFGTIAFGIAGLLWLVFRNINKVSFLMYGSSVIFWFSMPIGSLVQDHLGSMVGFIFRNNYQWILLFVFCFLSLNILFFVLRYFPKLVGGLNKILGVFVSVLSGLLLLNIVQKFLFEDQNIDVPLQYQFSEDNKQYPNVYHILLDAHPNQKAMEVIGGDLRSFYEGLKSLGFVTFPESRSNYPATHPSVASMLNMNYLPEDWEGKSTKFFRSLICNNEVFKNFCKMGYGVHCNLSQNVVVQALYGNCQKRNDFKLHALFYTILANTPLRHVFLYGLSNSIRSSALQDVNFLIEKINTFKNFYGATMNVCYTHILCPHGPCIFAEEREAHVRDIFFTKTDEMYILSPKTHRNYCKNVYGIDNLILRSIKEILKQYETEAVKPIIILHSDHSILYCGKDMKSPYITPDTIYGNLLALYVPNDWKQDAKDLKFINLYRWIFNHLFGDNYKYFEDNFQK